jgi:DEAD/DEAH box helicase domain-containing protein
MSSKPLLERWKSEPEFSENVAAWEFLSPRPAGYVGFPSDLPTALRDWLSETGINQLYKHQLLTWDAVHQGDHVVLTTGTASGKSLAYNLCSLTELIENPAARALYIFPTKALAQDQYTKLSQMIPSEPKQNYGNLTRAAVGIYDGDTPSGKRQKIRQQTRLLITNPDMLHLGILPHHTRWIEFFAGLHLVIMDEVHIYRGVFGSHIANVIRRLQRIARFYDSEPQFIFTSATIDNACELCSKLIGSSVRQITENHAASGEKEFIIFNPPVIDHELGLRRGVLQECQSLIVQLEAYHLQTLVFVRSRRSVEMLVRVLLSKDMHLADSQNVRGYRSGYLPSKRREIEAALRNGQAKTVVATNALELGIDIGGLDAVILSGYPGTIASTWQQAGRAGRSDRGSAIIILVLGSNPLDQFIAQHPEFIFQQNPERALINPDHPLILFEHLQCAAYELPFKLGDIYGSLQADELAELLQLLAAQGAVHHAKNRFYWVSDYFPAAAISLRSASSEKVLIQSDGRTIAEVDLFSAYWMVHPEAVYLQEGQSYLVRSLDLVDKIAVIESKDLDYFTEATNRISFSIEQINKRSQVAGGEIYQIDLTVTSQVTGFRRIQWGSQTVLSRESLDMPAVDLVTEGFLFSIYDRVVDQLRLEGFWENDPINYGLNWETARALALARDRNMCQICRSTGETSRLHVHHKIPFRTFPSSLEANQLPNLVTLCPACHQKAEQNLRIRSGLSGVGYVLVNLAPFFLMCDRNDLGLHTDPRSALLDQSPTVLIYEQIPAGIGLSQEIFQLHPQLIRHAYDLVTSCACIDGCPSCVGPAGENGIGGKEPAKALLRSLR